jgi:hypothetical protein
MSLPSFSDPLFFRGLLTAFGLILCVFGSHLYQLVVLAPGILGGLWAGLLIGRSAGLDPTPTLAVAGGLALVGALLCHFVETTAVRITGAVVFGTIGWLAWPMFRDVRWEAMVAAGAGAILGGALFPRIYSFMVKVATSAMGGLLLAEAAQRPQNLWIVGGATIVGILIQSAPWKLPGGSKGAKVEKKEKKKK